MRKLVLPNVEEKVDRREWDFSLVPAKEERACCFYEYAREAAPYILKQLRAADSWNKEDIESKRFRNSPLIYALPPTAPKLLPKLFKAPWLAKDAKWRALFCEQLSAHWEGLSYARAIGKTDIQAFDIGILQFFPWQRWTEQHTRLLDKETGLELLLVTIDWNNFNDAEIIKEFTRWIKSKRGRPLGAGLRHSKGKRTDTWRKKLERLAVLRLRHYYSLEDMASLLPEAWQDRSKFLDEREIRRERKAAQQTLLELFPFLPENTRPKSFSAA